MEFEKLTAQVRTGRKKGVARRLRREGFIPAVCYGPDMSPLTLSVDPKALSDALRGPLGRNVVVEMSVEGDGAPKDHLLVMLQDFQYHPLDRKVLHADFLHVAMDRDVHVQVPFVIVGKAAGTTMGGVVQQVFRTLPVRCKPDAIPTSLELDVTSMELNNIRKVSDVALPAGVAIELEPNLTLVSCVQPTQAKPEATEGEEEAVEAEGAEGGEKKAEGGDEKKAEKKPAAE
jgi:large subunit ribosomal protein L25